ncbi:CBS domain-containing protein [Bacillus fengqiuensis]|nr:CBS domain-containing protein [Bacillus fengqiuensis]
MCNDCPSYESIKKWKDEHISRYQSNTHLLNQFHDTVMKKVFDLSIVRLKKGNPPSKYSWFITGSGGRFEQGLISDQDHGIVFEGTANETEEYFRAMGEELSYGLNIVGYPFCEGNVMSSNPLWCQSLEGWENQLLKWMKEESWESIRYLQIFYDARSVKGEERLVSRLKSFIHDFQKEHPALLKRFMENVMHLKKAIGPLGQILVEDKGVHEGSIDLKHAAFLPYVNAIRLLAIKEGIVETSTLDRMDRLMAKGYEMELMNYKSNFVALLDYRVSLFSQVKTYDDTHYLNIKNLSKVEKREIKQILKDGKKLHQYVQGMIEKGVS